MMRLLGESFAPTAAADGEIAKPNAAQQAIQVLSMRLPRVRGARSISPLVGESRSAGAGVPGGFSPDSAVLQSLMRARGMTGPGMDAFGAGGGSMSDPMAAAMAALGGGLAPTAPVVTPGIRGPGPVIVNPPPPVPPIVPPPPVPEPARSFQMPEQPSLDAPDPIDPTAPLRGRRRPLY